MARKPTATENTATMDRPPAKRTSLREVVKRREADAGARRDAAIAELWKLAQEHHTDPDAADGETIMRLVSEAKLGNALTTWGDWTARAAQRVRLAEKATEFAQLDKDLATMKVHIRACREGIPVAKRAVLERERDVATALKMKQNPEAANNALKSAREHLVRITADEENSTKDFNLLRLRWHTAHVAAKEFSGLVPEAVRGELD